MRTVGLLPLALAATTVLAACDPTTTARPPDSTPPAVMPPTVAYPVIGADPARADAKAIAFCRQYGMGALSQGLTVRDGDNFAIYSCSGQVVVGALATAPAPMLVAPSR